MKQVAFVGSFPKADFSLPRRLPEVAFVGRSNVGKSSLINAVLGRKSIARTSKTPGKTRECNVYLVENAHYLVDLPGYGYAKVSKTEHKRLGSLVTSYLGQREPLAGVVWLLDIRRDLSQEDQTISASLGEGEVPVLVVLTKSDKLGPGKQEQRIAAVASQLGLPPDQVLVTSSMNRSGIDDLVESIDALVAG